MSHIAESSNSEMEYSQFVNPYCYDQLCEVVGSLNFVSATGSYIEDDAGNQWLDLVAQYGSASLGHNNPNVRIAIEDYLSKSPVHIHPWDINHLAGTLAKRLCTHSPIQPARVVYGSTGSEAVEIAMKMALAKSGRKHCVAFEGGYHGLTLRALGLMGDSIWAKPLPQLKQGCVLPTGNGIETWSEVLESRQYAAVVLELVQGIGGGRSWNSMELERLQSICRQTGTLLIVDEVQTGIGRCGEWFCCNLYPNFAPDMIVISKGLSGGLMPISAVITSTDAHDALFGQPGCARIHDSTFAGSGLAVATALSVLDVIEEDKLLSHVIELSDWFRRKLVELQSAYPIVTSVSGKGFLQCITFDQRDESTGLYVFQLLMENNIITNMAAHRANTIKLTPALTIEKQQLIEFLDVFEAIIAHVSESYSEVAI